MTPQVEVFRARSLRPRWRFRVRAANGAVTGQSSEAYTRRTDARRGARTLIETMRGDDLRVVDGAA